MINRITSVMKIAMMMLIVAIFVSCSSTQENNEPNSETMNKAMTLMGPEATIMRTQLELLAQLLDAEKSYFSGGTKYENYESFIDNQPYDYNVIEQVFSTADLDYLKVMSDLESELSDHPDFLTFQDYEKFLRFVYSDMMSYHYAMLESDYHMDHFAEAMNELYEVLKSGVYPSIEYNDGLDGVMTKYDALLGLGFNSDNVGDSFVNEELVSLLDNLSLAKKEIGQLKTNTDVDLQLNNLVYEMLDSVENAAIVTLEFEQQLTQSPYMMNQTSMLESASAFYTETMGMVSDPFSVDE